MKIQYSYNEAEARAREVEYFKTPAGRQTKIIKRVAGAVTCLMGMFLAACTLTLPFPIKLITGISIAIALALSCLHWFDVWPTMVSGAMKPKWQIRIGDMGMAISTDNGEEEFVDWTKIAGWELDDLFIKLAIPIDKKPNYFLIPRRSFSEEVEMHHFLALVDQYRNLEKFSHMQQETRHLPWWRNRHAVEESSPTQNRSRLR